MSSPTGFHSSAVRNEFIKELEERNARQVAYAVEPVGQVECFSLLMAPSMRYRLHLRDALGLKAVRRLPPCHDE